MSAILAAPSRQGFHTTVVPDPLLSTVIRVHDVDGGGGHVDAVGRPHQGERPLLDGVAALGGVVVGRSVQAVDRDVLDVADCEVGVEGRFDGEGVVVVVDEGERDRELLGALDHHAGGEIVGEDASCVRAPVGEGVGEGLGGALLELPTAGAREPVRGGARRGHGRGLVGCGEPRRAHGDAAPDRRGAVGDGAGGEPQQRVVAVRLPVEDVRAEWRGVPRVGVAPESVDVDLSHGPSQEGL